MNDPTKKELEDHERRIAQLEAQLAKMMSQPTLTTAGAYTFSDRKKDHSALLEELLKSEYCLSNGGLTFEMVIDEFNKNGRPVDTDKIRKLLGVWKVRKKIDAAKKEGILRYFWVDNE